MRSQEGSQSLNRTKQPPTVPESLKEGRYLVVKVGGMDAEERGDQDALGLRFIRWLEGKIRTIHYFWCATMGVHCGSDTICVTENDPTIYNTY